MSFPSSLFFDLLTCFVLSVLVDSEFFFVFSYFRFSYLFFSEMQEIRDKLTPFYSNVLSPFFGSILFY